MPEKFLSIAELIDTDPGLSKVKNIIKEADVITEFADIFPNLIKIAVPVKVDKQILFLRVENSVWRSELRLKEKVIIEKTNKFFNETRINKVKFIP
jgi:hypothetical protein